MKTAGFLPLPRGLAFCGAALLFAPATSLAQPVYQRTAPAPLSGDTLRLNIALARLARDPRDVGALIDAGNAALATHDTDAAIGFFKRANQIEPRNSQALSGLAGALLQNDDPAGAIAMFDQASAAGAHGASVAADRGLAHDLVGDTAGAQQFYREALKQGDDPETQRRLALSLAISGDAQGAEATLRPLLQGQDRAGWRVRVFIFAIGGRVDEAVTTARTLLPPDLAAAITPYLRYMPQLTRAQQAAAANLGVFPRASDIGHDDPRVAQYIASHGGPAATSVDRTLAPAGEPLGHRAERDSRREPRALSRSERAAQLAARAVPPDPVPVRQVEDTPVPTPTPTSAPAPAPAPTPVAIRVVTAPSSATVTPGTVYGPPDAASPPRRLIVLPPTPASGPAAGPVASPVNRPVAAPSAATAVAPRRPASLADAFSDLGKPTMAASPRAGAVDVARLAAARAKAAKPPPPSHPSRIWVQLETGRGVEALATDWHRFTRESGGVLRGHEPSISEWGARDRLLTGPFESDAAAQRFLQQLARAGLSGPFIWVSPAGQVVDSLEER
jgi:Flp pilus assembly protein TadD